MEEFRTFFSNSGEFGRFGKVVEYKQNKLLEEWLITSYPISNVLSMLSNKYKNVITYIQSNPFHKDSKTAGVSMYVDNSIVDNKFIEQLQNNLKVYGYFIAFNEPYGKNETGFLIEPKYSFLIEPKYLKNKRCFHITHKKFLDKISKKG